VWFARMICVMMQRQNHANANAVHRHARRETLFRVTQQLNLLFCVHKCNCTHLKLLGVTLEQVLDWTEEHLVHVVIELVLEVAALAKTFSGLQKSPAKRRLGGALGKAFAVLYARLGNVADGLGAVKNETRFVCTQTQSAYVTTSLTPTHPHNHPHTHTHTH
jgi:hypothetical protein